MTPPTDDANDDRPLQLDLRRFDVAAAADRPALVWFPAKLPSADGHVRGTHIFEAKASTSIAGDPAAVKALSAVFGAAVVDLGRRVAQGPGPGMLPGAAEPSGLPKAADVPL